MSNSSTNDIALKNVEVKDNILTILSDSGEKMYSDSVQNYTLKFYGVQTPVIGDNYLEVIFSHPAIDYPIVLKSKANEPAFEKLKEFCKYMKENAKIDIVQNRKQLPTRSLGPRWKTGRMIIGIISIVLFLLIALQSCAAGVGNALEENGSASGSMGLFLAIFMLLSGIIGICTRNLTSKVGPIVCTVFYWLGSILTIGTGETYGDLPIWGTLSFIFGLVYLISVIKTKE